MSKNIIYEIVPVLLIFLLFAELHGIDINWQLTISNSIALILLIDKLLNLNKIKKN